MKFQRILSVACSVFLTILFFKATTIKSHAQVTVSGNIRTEITSIINAMPNDTSGNDFIRPTAAQLATWERTFILLMNGDYAEAEDSAALLDYSLTEFTDDSEGFNEVLYMLKNTGTNYWGTYIINPTFCKPLVIQSPHPKFDFNTGKQGIYVFRKTDGYCFMMSGAHRCSSSTYSSCAGTTGVCTNGTEDFRISDPAHYDSSLFHFTTKLVFDHWSATYFIQLHGFTKGGSDPYVIMSNGTRDTPTVDYLDVLDNKLYDEDNNLTFKLMHVDTTWTKQAGLTNTQGRYINGSANPCGLSASTSTGRFLHLEQEKTLLRATEAGWAKMANALNNTFACGALPIHLLSFNGARIFNGNQLKWTTASEINNAYFEVQRSFDGVNWVVLHKTDGAGNSSSVLNYSYLDHYVGGLGAFYRLHQVDFDGNASLSKVVFVNPKEKVGMQIYPNPNSGLLNIVLPYEELAMVKISSTLGEEVLTFNMQEKSILKDVSSLKPGIYWVNVILENDLYTKVLIVN